MVDNFKEEGYSAGSLTRVTFAMPIGPERAIMTETASIFAVKGHLRGDITSFSAREKSFAQIMIRGDVEWEGREFRNACLLTLEVNGNIDDGWQCRATYANIFPRLRPIKQFREFLIEELMRIRDAEGKPRSPTDVIWMGLGTFIRQLREVDDDLVLAEQAKEYVDFLFRRLRSDTITPENRELFRKQVHEIITLSGGVPITEAVSFQKK